MNNHPTKQTFQKECGDVLKQSLMRSGGLNEVKMGEDALTNPVVEAVSRIDGRR